MDTDRKRRKQPEIIRRRLLDETARIALEKGLQAVTVEAVARGAGVTKGGLFHHFPSKEALMQAVFEDQLQHFDALIDMQMDRDGASHGCFTRAYVTAVLDIENGTPAALSNAMIVNADLRRLWSVWLRRRLERHGATDAGPELEIIRYAADGYWLTDLWEVDADLKTGRDAFREQLLFKTRNITPQ